ncbi:deaminase domain-containing protein [Chryseobacterium lineare]
MSRHKKTFAPRANRSGSQNIHHKEDEENQEKITSQDVTISLAKTEVTQITYGLFRNRAFKKVENGSVTIKFLEKGPHVLILNKALNILGYKAVGNGSSFWKETKMAIINFQQKNGIIATGIFNRETLLKMDEVLSKIKDEKPKKDDVVLSAAAEKLKTNNSIDDDSVIYPIVVAKNQKFNGKLIQTDEDLNHFAEQQMKLTRHLKWEPKFTDEKVKDIVAKGGSVNYRISSKEHTIEKETEALSPDKKEFIRNPASTADYIQNTRILDLLKQLSEEEMADYKSKVSQETSDLTAIEESLKAYIKERDKNLKNRDELETVKTKLYGLEKLYDQYIKYLGISPTTNVGTIKEPLIVDNPMYSFKEKELTEAMKANGFDSIKEFEDYIRRYESAFETETVRIGIEMLQHYKHTLYQEEKKLSNITFLDHLSQSIIKSGAQEDYETGKSIKSNSKKVLEHGISYTDQQEYSLGQSKINNANKSISLLSSQTPLVNDPDFDKEEFAEISNKTDLKAFLNEYITSQNEKVNSVINNITENPEHIYELDNLFKASYEKQHIEKGSIYDRIITAKYDRLKSLEILLAICEGIFALALIVVTWGAATPVVIAGGALSLAVSIDVAYDTIKEYKDNKEFHDVGLLSDDPSLVWVVVAIAGVALDAAALGAVLKSAKPIAAAGKAFNEAEDATKAINRLESDLAKIEGLEERVQQNIVRQAKIQAQEKKILDGFVKARQLTYATIPGLPQAGELLARAVFAIRKGIVTFDSFIAELKLAKVIKETGLNPEELLAVKNAFEEARTLAKDEKLVAELEKAIAENDVAKVKSLLGETEDIGLVTQGTEEEILQAAKRIKDHRAANNLRGGNYGYIEGQINGKVVDNRLWRSVPLDVAENEIHIFNAIKVEGNKGKEWLRITDSEYRMLNKLAKDLGAKKGGKYLEIVGEIKIVSENPYCISCTGIIQQFNEMFPNIKIILINGAK